MRNIRRRTRGTGALVSLVAAGFLLASCGGGGSESGATNGVAAKSAIGDSASSPVAAGRGGADEARSSGGEGPARASTSARVLPAPRDIIYRGNVAVSVKNVDAAAERVEQIALGVDGEVFSAQLSSAGRPGTSSAHLTLKVPPADFRAVMASVAKLGTRLRQSQTAEDVTTQVVDTESRIATQRRSVARVRALLDEAKTNGQVVQVESELSRREADLESLEAQLARLKDVTELATIEVDLVGRAAPTPKAEEDELGFVAGLRGGWDAFVQVVLVALTVLGALLPFALTLGLVGVPIWLLVRSRLRTRRVAPPEAPAT